MINTSELIDDIKNLNSDVDRLREVIGEGPAALRTNILAALIVAQAIHKQTIQTINLYSAIQDLTSTIRESMSPPSKIDISPRTRI